MTALSPRARPWDHAVPPALRPLVRAYLLGYASTVAPQLLTVVLASYAALRRRRRKTGEAADAADAADVGSPTVLCASVRRILRGGLGWHRFPTFCAALIGGSSLLEVRYTYFPLGSDQKRMAD